MAKSTKNILQEIYQSKGGELPWYVTELSHTSSTTPLWESTVVLPDTNERISGEMSARKVVAEASAASSAIAILKEREKLANKKKTKIRQQNTSENISEVVLIDIESIPQSLSLDEICNVLMIGFISNQSPLKHKVSQASYEVKIIGSSIPDAADHLLSFTAGRITADLSEKKDKITFWVVTADHMGDAVVSCLVENGWRAHRLTNSLEMDRIISGFKSKYNP